MDDEDNNNQSPIEPPTDVPLYVPSVYLDEAILGFFLGFLFTPFAGIGYMLVFVIVALEIFTLFYYATPRCYPTRMFVILVTVFGRLLGEVFWTFLAHKGLKTLKNGS